MATSYLKEDSKYYYYKATTPGFSYFAVAVKPKVEEKNETAEEIVLQQNKTLEEGIQTEELLEQPLDEKPTNLWRFLYIALGVIGIFLAFLFYELRIHERKR